MAWFGGQKLRWQDLTLRHLVHDLPLPLRMGKWGRYSRRQPEVSGLDTRAYGTVMGATRKGTEKERQGKGIGKQQRSCICVGAMWVWAGVPGRQRKRKDGKQDKTPGGICRVRLSRVLAKIRR